MSMSMPGRIASAFACAAVGVLSAWCVEVGTNAESAVDTYIPAAPAEYRRPAGWKGELWPEDLRTLAAKHAEEVRSLAAAKMREVNKVNANGLYHAAGESIDRHLCPAWFADAKLGIFVDWGPWSVASWAPYSKGGRFYPDGYENHCDFPIGSEPGERDALFRAYHLKNWGADFHRDHFLALFRAESFDARSLMGLARRAGAKYVVPFMKHHGGFCLWDCPYTFRDACDWGPRRDLAREMADACRAEGLKFGFYFSHGLEWGYPIRQNDGSIGFVNAAGETPTPYRPEMEWTASGKVAVRDFVKGYIVPSAADFIDRYDPDILWYDGDWVSSAKDNGAYDIAAYFYNRAEGRKEVACNDRFGFGTPEEVAHKKTTRGGVYGKFLRAVRGDFYTSETADIAEDLDPASDHPWEECHGISHAYGNHWQDDEKSVMGERELIVYFTDIVARGGNLLLMVNLDGRGRVPDIQRKRLEALGKWLERWGDAIYGTRPLRPYSTESVHYLRSKDCRRQFAVVVKNSRTVELACDVPAGARVRVLGESHDLPIRRTDGGTLVTVSSQWAEAAMPYVLEILVDDGRLVRRTTPAPAPWRAPAFLGRDFWAMMTFDPADTWLYDKGGCPEDIAMFREAALRVYQEGNLGINEWERAKNYRGDWAVATDPAKRRKTKYRVEDFFPSFFKSKDLSTTRPFFLQVKESRPCQFLRSDGYPLADRDAFREFRQKYPNFLGFRGLSEYDGDFTYYGYHLAAETVADESVRTHFKEKFPLREDGGWRAREWTARCYADTVSLHFGCPDIWPMTSAICGMQPMAAAAVADGGGSGFVYEASTQSWGPWELAGAFTRGASRQNHLPFGWYMANYYEGTLRDGSFRHGENRWCDFFRSGSRPEGQAPHLGGSRSLLARQLVYGWLIGACNFCTEAWQWLYVTKKDGKYVPSDECRDADEIYRLSKRVDRGFSRTPLAVLVSADEPIWLNFRSDGLRDRYSQLAVFSTLVPTGARNCYGAPFRRIGEQGCFFNSEFGEIYDVFAADRGLPTKTMVERLASYDCAILVGDWFEDARYDYAALEAYVRAGGTLIVAADQIRKGYVPAEAAGVSFGDRMRPVGAVVREGSMETSLEGGYMAREARATTARVVATDENCVPLVYANDVGEGRVVSVACDKFIPFRYTSGKRTSRFQFEDDYCDILSGYGGMGLLKHLFRRIQSETMPIRVVGDCQWGVNRTPTGHLVWIFNNKGVRKWKLEPEQLDPTQTAQVTVLLGAGRVTELRDVRTGKRLTARDGKLCLPVPPGGWMVVSATEGER